MIVEGCLGHDGVFHAKAMGFPPCELRSDLPIAARVGGTYMDLKHELEFYDAAVNSTAGLRNPEGFNVGINHGPRVCDLGEMFLQASGQASHLDLDQCW